MTRTRRGEANETAVQTRPARPVTHRELDERLQALARRLGSDEMERVTGRPQWISAADLVRRLQHLLVYN